MYDQINILLSSDVFENFQNICLEIYKLDPARFLTATWLRWKPPLKKTKVELDLLTDFDMLLMIEKMSEEECVTLFVDM